MGMVCSVCGVVQLCKVRAEKQFDIHHQLNTVRIPSKCTTAMYTSVGVSHLQVVEERGAGFCQSDSLLRSHL